MMSKKFIYQLLYRIDFVFWGKETDRGDTATNTTKGTHSSNLSKSWSCSIGLLNLIPLDGTGFKTSAVHDPNHSPNLSYGG